MMTVWTTPTIQVTVKGYDLTGATYVYLTVSDMLGTIKVTKDSPTVTLEGEDSVVSAKLSQSEAGKFRPNTKLKIQINAVTGSTRVATKIATVDSLENLITEVLPNE